jgi:hypothetical protein
MVDEDRLESDGIGSIGCKSILALGITICGCVYLLQNRSFSVGIAREETLQQQGKIEQARYEAMTEVIKVYGTDFTNVWNNLERKTR